MRLKLSLGLTAVFLSAFFFIGWDAAQAEVPQPKLFVDSPVFNFGSVVEGTKVSRQFAIKNSGNADLVIQRLVAPCGCTAASASSDVIKPGETANILVEFDTAGFGGDKERIVRVLNNDPDTPIATLTMKGSIEPDVLIEPRSISFGEVIRSEGNFVSKQVIVRSRDNSGIELGNAKSLSPFIRVEQVSSSPQKIELKVSLDPTAPLGELRERVLISTTGKKTLSLNIPVFGVVRGQLRLSPAVLSFGILPNNQPIMRSVKLEGLGKGTFDIISLESSDEAISAKKRVIQPGKEYMIDVTVDPAKIKKDLRAALNITTNSTEDGALALNVYGMLSPNQ